jgi:hypothetical protein
MVLLRPLVLLVTFGGGIVLAILLATTGPTRLVRRLTAAYVGVLAILFAMALGPFAALRITTFAFALGVAGMVLALLSIRLPVPTTLAPIEPAEFPEHSRAEVQRRTDEAVAAGLQWVGDAASRFRVMGGEGVASRRFFVTPDRCHWVYTYASTKGKLVGVFASCVTDRQRCLRASNSMDDFNLLTTDATAARVTGPKATITDLLTVLEAWCRETGEQALPVDDAIATHAAVQDGWVRDLASSGRVRVSGAWAAPTVRALPGAIGQQLRIWLT